MTVTAEDLVGFITEVREERLSVERRLVSARSEMVALRFKRAEARAEVGFLNRLAGIAPEEPNLSHLPRVHAVLEATRLVCDQYGSATVPKVVEQLSRCGRDDTSIMVSGALTRLLKQGRVHRLARGVWADS